MLMTILLISRLSEELEPPAVLTYTCFTCKLLQLAVDKTDFIVTLIENYHSCNQTKYADTDAEIYFIVFLFHSIC